MSKKIKSTDGSIGDVKVVADFLPSPEDLAVKKNAVLIKPMKTTQAVPMLRELRRDLLLKISGGEKRIGNPEEIRTWMLKQYQENPLVGDMYRAILNIKEDLLLLPHELPSLEQSKLAINELEKSPLPEFCFVSSSMENKPRGVLIQRDGLQVGGLVYAVTIFNQQDLTKMASRMEIRAYSKEPEPFVSILTGSGWSHISREEIHHEPHPAFILQWLVKIITYDDLLERMRRLITMLGQ